MDSNQNDFSGNKPKPRLRSTVLGFAVAVVIALAGFVFIWEPLANERRVVEILHRHGKKRLVYPPTVSLDPYRHVTEFDPEVCPGAIYIPRTVLPTWCQQFAPDELVRATERLELINLTDASLGEWPKRDMARLARLSKLKVLQCDGIRGADTAVQYFQRLPNLECLDLRYSDLTDAGMAHLRGMTKLRMLVLSRTSVTDRGIAHLRSMDSLERLELDGTNITDDGLRHLKSLHGLTMLNLSKTHVGNRGLVHLQALTSLRILQLDYTKVTDTAGLASLGRLEELTLFHTAVDDLGAEHLMHLHDLKTLDLSRTEITEDGIGFLSHLKNLESLQLPIGVPNKRFPYDGPFPDGAI